MTDLQAQVEPQIVSVHLPQTKLDFDPISAIILSEENAQAFRAIRLRALREDGKYFAANYHEEFSQPLSEWQEACRESCNRAVFGAFSNDEIVGIMRATRNEKDPNGSSVIWGWEYVAPEHRGTGVRCALYSTRMKWSLERGFTEAFFSIRADNERSIKSHMRDGAEYVSSQQRQYADQSIATSNVYRRSLQL